MRTWRGDGDPTAKTEEIFYDNGDTLPARFNVDSKDVKIGEKIGEGQWTVHKAKWLGRDVAVKKFDCDSTFGNVSLTSKEVNRMLSLRHPNIVKLLGFYLSVQSGLVLECTMIMELMDGDLEEYLDKGPLSDDQVVYILAEVARGMKHIHEMGCFHRDLKPKNVLLRESRVTRFNVDVKIADLGSSELVSQGCYDRRAGTTGYKAPEQFDPEAKMLQDKVDAFSFGALCFKVLTGKRPYKTYTNVRETVEKIDRASICIQNLPEDVVEVIWKCLDTNPEGRPDFERISSILDGALADIREKMPRPLALSSSTPFHSQESTPVGVKGHECSESVLRSWRFSKKYGVNFIPAEELLVFGLTGQGAIEAVYKVEWKGVSYAQKVWDRVINEDDIFSPFYSNGIVDGFFQTVPKLCHKNIVTFMGYSITRDNELSMIMELQAMDLASVLESEKVGGRESILNDDLRMTIIREIAEGMKYLHEQGVAHGDLKPANVVLSALDSDEMAVKLIDFANSPRVYTTLYASPEKLKNQSERRTLTNFGTKQADVYSFGILCLEILGGTTRLWSHEKNYYSPGKHRVAILKGERPQMPEGASPKMKDLIRSIWDHDPRKRPTFAEICASFASLPEQAFCKTTWTDCCTKICCLLGPCCCCSCCCH